MVRTSVSVNLSPIVTSSSRKLKGQERGRRWIHLLLITLRLRLKVPCLSQSCSERFVNFQRWFSYSDYAPNKIKQLVGPLESPRIVILTSQKSWFPVHFAEKGGERGRKAQGWQKVTVLPISFGQKCWKPWFWPCPDDGRGTIQKPHQLFRSCQGHSLSTKQPSKVCQTLWSPRMALFARNVLMTSRV